MTLQTFNALLDRWIYAILMIGLMWLGRHIDGTLWDYSLTLQGFTIEECYRLVTGHFMHVGSEHVWQNAEGLALITIIFCTDKAPLKHLFGVTVLAMIAINGLFYFDMSKEAEHYVGYSAILFAIAGYSGVRQISIVPSLGKIFLFLVCLSIGRDVIYYSDSMIAIDAHILGFIVGMIFALFFRPTVDSIPQIDDTASITNWRTK